MRVGKTEISGTVTKCLYKRIVEYGLNFSSKFSMKLSHGVKSALLDGKLRTGTSITKKSHAWLVEIALFLEAVAFFCHPA